MRNDITATIEVPGGAHVQRIINPGGEFQLEPGERLVAAWAGDAAPAGQETAHDGLHDMLARDLERYEAVDGERLAAGQPSAITLLYNRANMRDLLGEPQGPFGYIKWQDQTVTGLRDITGTTLEDVLEACRQRLIAFQAGPWSCRENAAAATRIEEAIMWLNRRTELREVQGVEGAEQPHADPLWPLAPFPLDVVVQHETQPVVSE